MKAAKAQKQQGFSCLSSTKPGEVRGFHSCLTHTPVIPPPLGVWVHLPGAVFVALLCTQMLF